MVINVPGQLLSHIGSRAVITLHLFRDRSAPLDGLNLPRNNPHLIGAVEELVTPADPAVAGWDAEYLSVTLTYTPT